MTENRARRILGESVRDDGSLGARKAASAAPAATWAPLEALSNDEVYEQLKKYRCFGMTTREMQ